MTDSQVLEIERIFVNGKACEACPHLKDHMLYGDVVGWTSCDVLSGKAPYEECQGVKGEVE